MPPKSKKARVDEAASSASSASSVDATRNPSTGVVRFEGEIHNITASGIFSPEVEIMGLPWKLLVKRNHSSAFLEAYLYSRTSDSGLWAVNVAAELYLLNADRSKNVPKKFNVTYSSERMNWGFSDFCGWLDIYDEEKGFTKDGKFTVAARLTLSNIIGIRTISQIDYTDANDPRHDVALVIEGEKVHCSKQILAVHSPVFNVMFYGQFAEKDKKEIVLKDIKREEFIEMLNLIYPTYQKITDANTTSLLRLADQYQVKTVIDQVELFFINSAKLDISSKLQLSDQYRLVKLQDACLDKLTTVKTITDLNKTDASKLFSKDLKATLLDKITKLTH